MKMGTDAAKDAASEELAAAVERFKAEGGRVQQLRPGESSGSDVSEYASARKNAALGQQRLNRQQKAAAKRAKKKKESGDDN